LSFFSHCCFSLILFFLFFIEFYCFIILLMYILFFIIFFYLFIYISFGFFLFYIYFYFIFFFFSSRRRHTRSLRDWSSDVCSSDLRIFGHGHGVPAEQRVDHEAVGVECNRAGATCEVERLADTQRGHAVVLRGAREQQVRARNLGRRIADQRVLSRKDLRGQVVAAGRQRGRADREGQT